MDKIHKIVTFPDSRLRVVTNEIETIDDSLQCLIDEMFATMYDARGVGLAATQIGLDLRIAVIDVEGDKKNQLTLINPVITSRIGTQTYHEGCLSVPGIFDKVNRAKEVTLRATDRNGEPYEISADGLLGECIQHEVDHLHGKLFLDLLPRMKQDRLRKRLKQLQRRGE